MKTDFLMIGWIAMIEILFLSLILIVGIIIVRTYLKIERSKLKTKFENEKTIFQLVESSKDIIYHYQVKPEQKFIYLSPSLDQIMGAGAVQKNYEDAQYVFKKIHPDDYATLYKKVFGELKDYNKSILQRWTNIQGDYVWFEEYATPVYRNGQFVAIEGIMRNISEKIALQEKLEYQITHDSLTGIYNREFFERNMDKYNKNIDASVAIILCDLDELKYLNDNYGHKKGDILIKESAKLLKYYFKENAIVSRIGGDEFAVIIVNMDKAQVESKCEKLTKEIIEYNINSNVKVKLSLGYAFSEHSIGKMESLFIKADQKMYQEKKEKKEQNKLSLSKGL